VVLQARRAMVARSHRKVRVVVKHKGNTRGVVDEQQPLHGQSLRAAARATKWDRQRGSNELCSTRESAGHELDEEAADGMRANSAGDEESATKSWCCAPRSVVVSCIGAFSFVTALITVPPLLSVPPLPVSSHASPLLPRSPPAPSSPPSLPAVPPHRTVVVDALASAPAPALSGPTTRTAPPDMPPPNRPSPSPLPPSPSPPPPLPLSPFPSSPQTPSPAPRPQTPPPPPREAASLVPMHITAASMSSVYDWNSCAPDRCIDGIHDVEGNFCHSAADDAGTGHDSTPWLALETAGLREVGFVQVYNRKVTQEAYCEGCLGRLASFEIWVGDSPGGHGAPGAQLCAAATAPANDVPLMIPCNPARLGRFVTIALPGEARILNLAEVYLYEAAQPSPPPLPPSRPDPPAPPPSPPSTPPPPPPPSSPPDDGEAYELHTGWQGYRIGDMILSRAIREEPWCDGFPTCRDFHCVNWPTSLACRYMHATNDEGNYTALANIIRSNYADAIWHPPNDAVVAHLRVGDVFESYGGETRSVWELLNGPPVCNRDIQTTGAAGGEARHCYIKNLDYYRAQIAKLPPNVRTVYLIAGSHISGDYWRSSEYIRGVRDFFLSQGFVVHMRLGGIPDDDTVFAANARYFILGGGGFSVLISNVNLAVGGTVLTDPAESVGRLMCGFGGCEWDAGR